MNSDNPKCETCRWFGSTFGGKGTGVAVHGRCHRNPPPPSGFPLVTSCDFCGEHSALQVSAEAKLLGMQTGMPGVDIVAACNQAGSAVGDAAVLTTGYMGIECQHDWETLRMEAGGYERKCRLCEKFEFVLF